MGVILAQAAETPSVMDWVAWALGSLLAVVLTGAVCLLVIYGIRRVVRLCRPRRTQVSKNSEDQG